MTLLDVSHLTLRAGDTMIVLGSFDQIRRIRSEGSRATPRAVVK